MRQVCSGPDGQGSVRYGEVRQVWRGYVWIGAVRLCRSAQARFVGVCGGAAGKAALGAVRSGNAGEVWQGEVGYGGVGQVWRGGFRLGNAGYSTAGIDRPGMVRIGDVWSG